MLIFRLFWEFFKTGLFAIGGGLATLPFLYDMQAATGWFTLDDISNMIAISESTPGPMGINMATYTAEIFPDDLQIQQYHTGICRTPCLPAQSLQCGQGTGA